MKTLVIENVKDFSLDHIFDCGQCFRWNKEDDGSYTGVALGYPSNLSFRPYGEGNGFHGDLEINSDCILEEMWRDYLDLDRDYGLIKNKLSSGDGVMEKAIQAGQGLRVLNQNKWETLISFIISQNNNISRIKKCVESICRNYGQSLGVFMGEERFDFPSVDSLSLQTPETLEVCRLGYRARYIAETARLIKRDGGTRLALGSLMTEAEARDYLLTLSGVGPKVADCILLFSMEKDDSFPIDVWVARIMNRLYGIPENDHKAMRDYADANFAPYGGIAQQYLFNYIRKEDSDQEKAAGGSRQE